MLRFASFVVTAVALGACTAQGPTLNAQAEQMELALVACKARLGLGGQLQTEVTFDGGIARARAVSFDKITPADADQINACAGQPVTLSDGMEVVPLSAAAVATVPVVAVQSTLPVETPVETVPVHNGPCPVGYTGMYAGTLYCTDGSL